MVEIYTRVSIPSKRDEILASFCTVGGKLRLIIATIAFGMGIDCPDIQCVMHWGLPSDREEYAQESGRAGRNGRESEAVLFQGKTGHYSSKEMKAYSSNFFTCRRSLLFDGFIGYSSSNVNVTKNRCCDVCASECS